jgi:phosphohistidine phosphatase
MTVIRECDDRYSHILIAGHNPGITEFADQLSSERRIDSMPTCALVTMRFNVDAWSKLVRNSAVDVELDYPGRSA